MTRHDAELARQLYRPAAHTLAANLPNIADGLAGAFITLSRDPTPDGCDLLISRLQSAENIVTRLRVALLESSALGRSGTG
jgi:hypothetical protein